MDDCSEKDRGPMSQGNHQGQGQWQGYGYGYDYRPPQHPYLQHTPAYNYAPGTQAQPAPGPAYGYSRPYDAPLPGYESHNQIGYGNSLSPPNSHGHQLQSYSSSGAHYQNVYSPALHGGSGPMPGPYANTSAAATPMNQPSSVNRPGPQTLLLRQSPSAEKIIFIHPTGVPVTSPPLYCLSSSANAEYVLARGSDPNNPTALVGQVKSHTFSSKYNMVVRGRTCLLKGSTLGSTYKIDIPGAGSYKWHTDDFSSKMWLKNENKSVLATYDKSKKKRTWKKYLGGKNRQLTIHGSFDEFTVEVILLSLYAVKLAEEAADETMEEILEAVSGVAGT
ncbi:hypothetical protein BDW72DRAFT_171836 [Aspergillus terricola var. indicus]